MICMGEDDLINSLVLTDGIDLMMGESNAACGCYPLIELGVRYSHFFSCGKVPRPVSGYNTCSV